LEWINNRNKKKTKKVAPTLIKQPASTTPKKSIPSDTNDDDNSNEFDIETLTGVPMSKSDDDVPLPLKIPQKKLNVAKKEKKSNKSNSKSNDLEHYSGMSNAKSKPRQPAKLKPDVEASYGMSKSKSIMLPPREPLKSKKLPSLSDNNDNNNTNNNNSKNKKKSKINVEDMYGMPESKSGDF